MTIHETDRIRAAQDDANQALIELQRALQSLDPLDLQDNSDLRTLETAVTKLQQKLDDLFVHMQDFLKWYRPS